MHTRTHSDSCTKASRAKKDALKAALGRPRLAGLARPSRVMVTTDFSDSASAALPYAAAVARRYGAELVIVHVMPHYPGDAEYSSLDGIAQQGETLTEQELGWCVSRIQLLETGGVQARREIVRANSPAEGILKRAKIEHTDLMVMSSRGHGVVAQVLLGSVTRKVIAASPCPVLLVKSGFTRGIHPKTHQLRVKRILVPTDLSEASNAAITGAAAVARIHQAEVHVLHVVHFDVPATIFIPPGRPSVFEFDTELRARIEESLHAAVEAAMPDERVTVHVDEGPPVGRIASCAETNDIDLIVLSRRGGDNSPCLMGGVTERLIHDVRCPMLIL